MAGLHATGRPAASPLPEERPVLGVLGGMGPLATADFMAKLVRATPATCDQDHIDVVAFSAASIPDRIGPIFGRGPDPFPAMRAVLRRLEAAGATCIAIPCNTAHHWHAALQAETARPILHIVDAVVDGLAADGVAGGCLGLLATDGTHHTGIYPQRLARCGFACRAPEPANQAEVLRAIRLVKIGRATEAAPILARVTEALLAAGCRRVVMACTEVPVALAAVGGDLGAMLVDATEALARAGVLACRPVARAAE